MSKTVSHIDTTVDTQLPKKTNFAPVLVRNLELQLTALDLGAISNRAAKFGFHRPTSNSLRSYPGFRCATPRATLDSSLRDEAPTAGGDFQNANLIGHEKRPCNRPGLWDLRLPVSLCIFDLGGSRAQGAFIHQLFL